MFVLPNSLKPSFRCALALFALGLAGCANTGAPKPPSLHLPRLAAHVSAERAGSTVRLAWETPANTTDGETLRGPVRGVVCRQEAVAQPCQVVAEATVAGASSAVDQLPAALTQGPDRLLVYRVELFNEKGRSAGPSVPVYVVAGLAPAAAGALVATPRRRGMELRWQPDAGSAIEIKRTLLASVAPTVKRAVALIPDARHKGPALPEVVTLAPGAGSADPGGTVDRTLRDGDRVVYQAQRVRVVKLIAPAVSVPDKNGRAHVVKAALQTLEIRGEPSLPVTVTFHDVIPPAAPVGLAAIPGGGFGQPPSIDLSWEPNPEADVEGYNIYRADQAEGPFVRLNDAPAPGPAYRDLGARPGHSSYYRVTAVDSRHNESAPSVALREELHP